ncbi:MAG TPA: AMP-binding protein, partial [Spirochaetia bacterium]|nr:AMP-binding protein [Spirochaetia bacterium]
MKYSSLAALKSRGTDGNYQILTYAELYTAVSELGTGLISVGLAAGMHVALVAENGPRWLISDLAILGIGGVDVPVSTGVADTELEQVVAHGDCEMAVVDNAGTLSRLLAMRKRIPRVRRILVLDFTGPKPSAGTGEERVLVYTWEEMIQKGRTRIARGQRTFDLRAASVTPADPATLLYTSGTTGKPKGVMLSHGNFMHNVTTIHASISPRPGSAWLSVLPVWHSFERTVEYCSIYFGSTIAYSQAAEWRLLEDLGTLGPNYLVLMPALLETLAKSIEKRLSFVENLLVRFEKFYLVFSGFIMGRYPRFRREERLLEIFAAVPALLTLSPIKLVSALTLRRKIRSLLGGALRAIVYGGGPLPAYLDRFFAAIGVDVLEGYGLTEASPIVSVRSERAPVLGTAGRPLPSTEVRIVGDKGEVLPPGRK